MPDEPGALITYTKTQICIYLSFQSGGDFPAETKELGFPKLKS